MQLKLDDEIILEIDDRMLKLIAHDIEDPIPDIKRRLCYIIQHKCDQCFLRLEKEWTDKLRTDPNISAIPSKKHDFIDFVFNHPEYKNRAQRELENI